MATLLTSASITVPPVHNENICTSTYGNFTEGRTAKQFGKDDYKAFCAQRAKFKKLVIDPLYNSSDKITVAGHFVIAVSELKALFEIAPEADFIHVYNTLDDSNTNYAYTIPVNSIQIENSSAKEKEIVLMKNDTIDDSKLIISDTSLLIASFPCPPDPRCMKFTMV